MIGLDANEELLAAARARPVGGVEFRSADLRTLAGVDVVADGLWCSFAAAYFVDLPAVLATWSAHLRRGGWIALTEIDDLFGHEPLDTRTASRLADYARDALDRGRYDFHMGRRLAGHLERSGFVLRKALTVADREFSFEGPAAPEVVVAWQARLDRMGLLREMCGAAFADVRADFLRCLASAEHRATSSVRCCIAHRACAPVVVR